MALHLAPVDCSEIHSTIFENNKAWFKLATYDPPRNTPRSKIIAVKRLWFRDHLEPGVIDVHRISSDKQLADMYTKFESSFFFISLWQQLFGWINKFLLSLSQSGGVLESLTTFIVTSRYSLHINGCCCELRINDCSTPTDTTTISWTQNLSHVFVWTI